VFQGPVRPSDNAVACGHCLGSGLGQVLQHPHEDVVAHHLARRVVDGGLVERRVVGVSTQAEVNMFFRMTTSVDGPEVLQDPAQGPQLVVDL